nr:EF-hand domain-containing protein [Amylibacter sp.]
MRNSVKIGLMGATAVMIALSATMPAMAKGRMGMQFDKLDINADGFVDKAELIAARDARFDAMDADKDGAVTQEEMDAHRKAMREEMRAARSEAGDKEAGGKREPSPEAKAELFKKLDTDGNGSLSPEEFDAAMKMRHDGMGEHGKKHHGDKRGGKDGHKEGRKGGDKNGRGGDRHGNMMAKLDANKDGKVTKDELGTEMADRMMSHMDTDKDGRISKAEAEAAHDKWSKKSK